MCLLGFPGGTKVKNLPANAGNTRDSGLIPELGRPPGVRNGNLLYILARKIPWIEEPGRRTVHGIEKSQT